MPGTRARCKGSVQGLGARVSVRLKAQNGNLIRNRATLAVASRSGTAFDRQRPGAFLRRDVNPSKRKGYSLRRSSIGSERALSSCRGAETRATCRALEEFYSSQFYCF